VLAIGDGAQIGVAGYLSKNQNLGQIAAALDAIAAGRRQLARVCVRYQWSQCTTSSKGRRLGRASGRNGRPAG
jgi:DNA-binding NarL/FixJ family response regulator